MNRGKEAEQNDNVFIGARVLGEDGVKLVLPTYDVLISQIEQMKSVARNSEKQNSNISRIMKYNKEHNNTIAIFGKRGTGKTSAVYTIMDYLLNQNDSNKKEKNIVLPIIEPDNFGDNTKIMGSIVGLIKNEVDEILTEIKSTGGKPEQYFRNCIYVENNPLKQKMDELLEHHMYSDSEYRNIITHNYTDTATHIKKSSHLLIPDINLKHKFWDVIDEIVKIYKNELNKDVMLFIFIDDIDLKTTKCKELIEAIIQYSSHPNVITILSGDYEVLEEGVMLSLIGDENLREKGLDSEFILKDRKLDKEGNIIGFTITDRKLELAGNYLKKIIPPSRRYSVVDWNIDNIPSFSFGKTKLKDILYKFYNNKDNIFGFKDNDENICSTKYPYIIFDNTPRSLINVYYSFTRVINNNKKSFFDIKSLIDTIINSSQYLLKNKEEFYEVINWGSDFESTKIDYKKLHKASKDNYRPKYNFICFIITDLLISCSDLISYDKESYDISKNNVISDLYYSYLSLLKNNDIKENRYIENETSLYSRNLYKDIIAFVKLLNFKESVDLLEHLCNFSNKEVFHYENYWDNISKNAEKDIWTFKCIFKFLEKNHILKNKLREINVYARENIGNNAKEIGSFIDFLENMSMLRNKFIYNMGSIYNSVKSIYDFEDIKYMVDLNNSRHKMNSVNNYIDDWKYSNQISGIYIERELTVTVIDNFFQEVCKLDNRKFKNKETSNNVKKLNELKAVNRKLCEEGLTNKQINLVRNLMDNIIGDFFKSISSDKLYESHYKQTIGESNINKHEILMAYNENKIYDIYNKVVFFLDKDIIEFNYSIINSGIKDFLSVNCGEYSKYYYVKKYVENSSKDPMNWDVFINMYREIKDLSENNRVWYGKYESLNFLDKLKKSININLRMIDFDIDLIKEIIKFEKNFNDINDKNNDLEFRKIQEIMRTELRNAFEDSRELIKNEYESIGISFNE